MSAFRVRIIAEAGVNHNGSLELALRLVDVAAEAGADVVKFQTFKAERLATSAARKAEYQKFTTGAAESQLDMLRRIELSEHDHAAVIARCAERGITFMSTPFDLDSLALLVDRFGVPEIKLGSGELNNAPLLLAVARTGRPVILSTGMATLGDVEDALGVLAFGYAAGGQPRGRHEFAAAYRYPTARAALAGRVTLLHCTTEYPAPFDEVNLAAMDTLRSAFGLDVGFSDHTRGIAVAIAAVARGARVIEKHMTLNQTLPGPDHKASIEPAEFAAMVTGIRQVEAALGSGTKVPAPSEMKNVSIARKSLVAARPIAAGEPFTLDNLTAKRPGTGVSPLELWDRLGRLADRAYASDEPIA